MDAHFITAAPAHNAFQLINGSSVELRTRQDANRSNKGGRIYYISAANPKHQHQSLTIRPGIAA